MAGNFERLYAELGVRPEAGPDVLRRAYRKRLRALHPDTRMEEAEQVRGSLHLTELQALYRQAMEMHQQLGRLPGAPPLQSARQERRLVFEPATGSPHSQKAPVPSRQRLLAFIAAVLLGLLLWYLAVPWSASPERTQALHVSGPEAALAYPEPTQARSPEPVTRLKLGMKKEDVLQIQGAPIEMGEQSWHYGPSWLRFEDGRLVDWYSSPLRPLKTPSASSP